MDIKAKVAELEARIADLVPKERNAYAFYEAADKELTAIKSKRDALAGQWNMLYVPLELAKMQLASARVFLAEEEAEKPASDSETPIP